MTWSEEELLPYRVGPLLYTPALNESIARKIRDGSYPGLTSVALCLEDSIRDEALAQAEASLLRTLRASGTTERLLFVRVRSPRHLRHVHTLLAEVRTALTGYILPKFDLSNAGEYARLIEELGAQDGCRFMPILETRMIADALNRLPVLMDIKAVLDSVRRYILNVRVGGTDLCNLYGLRRPVTQTIYDTGVVRDVLTDIVNIFAPDYVVSGPVWEYFGTDPEGPWAAGLVRELELDRTNGFIGKTAIHPAQLPLIYASMQVRKEDYEDARRILAWNSELLGVEKGAGRMNEMKCHGRWAKKTAMLAEIYGIREQL